jgi:rhodanese-related sulfurtransferase
MAAVESITRADMPDDAAAAAAADALSLAETNPAIVLDRAAVRRLELQLPYAGAVTPPEAWALLRTGAVQLIDVRTAPEFKFVGRVPETRNVEWHGADAEPRAKFLSELRGAARVDVPLLLLCRSGVRSHAAAKAATDAGFAAVYNVLEGFEGQIDAQAQRGRVNGWRWHGLPWLQD